MGQAHPRRVSPPDLLLPAGHDPAGGAADAAEQAWAVFAAAIAGRPRMRVSWRKFPRSTERSLTADLPNAPAAVMLFSPVGLARTLVLDLDAKRHGREQVRRDLDVASELLDAAGCRHVADISVSGGIHVYVPFTAGLSVDELRPVLRALAVRLPTLDISAMSNPSEGCIRPPGSRHRNGGYQQLLTAYERARAVFADRNDLAAWAALRGLLTSSAVPAQRSPADVGTAVAGAALPAHLDELARGGCVAPGYVSRSEARFAVLTSLAQRGWSLDTVTERVTCGQWAGLGQAYYRYGAGADRALRADWARAKNWAREHPKGTVRNPDTRPSLTGGATGPATQSSRRDPWLEFFLDAAWAAAGGRRWEERWGAAARVLLQALAVAAVNVGGDRVVDWGCRSLALGWGRGRTSTAELLARLAAEDDPFIEVLSRGSGVDPDCYRLRLPDQIRLTGRRRSPGRARAVSDMVAAVGDVGLVLYQSLDTTGCRVDELVSRAALSRSTVYKHLHLLAEHGLVQPQGRGKWRRGTTTLRAAALSCDVRACVDARIRLYRAERRRWWAWLARRLRLPLPAPAGDITAPPAPVPPIPAEQAPSTDVRAHNPADDPPLGPEPLDQPGETPIELLVRVLGAHVIAETPRRRGRVP